MTHEFDGKKYEQASAHQKEWGERLIGELDLRGDERVLDLGCGDGVLTVRIAGLVPAGQVVGIDASQGMIDAALPRARGNLSFRLLDINGMDFVEEFDVVFSNAALHWVLDHEKLLAKVRRALRPSGRVRFNFAGDGNCANFFAVVREAISLPAYGEDFASFAWPWYMPTVAAYTDLARASGLDEVKVWGENADRFFPDTETMIKWVDQPSLVPLLAHLPEGKRASFRDLVVEQMVAATRQEDGRCFETFRRINLLASR